MSLRMETITYPAHRCTRCGSVYRDREDGTYIDACHCGWSRRRSPVKTVPVEATVKYRDPKDITP